MNRRNLLKGIAAGIPSLFAVSKLGKQPESPIKSTYGEVKGGSVVARSGSVEFGSDATLTTNPVPTVTYESTATYHGQVRYVGGLFEVYDGVGKRWWRASGL